jgi:hypothetical protein
VEEVVEENAFVLNVVQIVDAVPTATADISALEIVI